MSVVNFKFCRRKSFRFVELIVKTDADATKRSSRNTNQFSANLQAQCLKCSLAVCCSISGVVARNSRPGSDALCCCYSLGV